MSDAVARRRLLLLLLGVAIAGLLVPTGGFSSTSMTRGVAVSVADHEDAVVAIWDPGGPSPEPPLNPGEKPVRSPGDPVVVLVIENRFGSRTLDVRVTDRARSPVDVSGGVTDVDASGIADVSATVDCNGARGRVTVPLELTVRSADGDVAGTIHYTASLVCGRSSTGRTTSGPTTTSGQSGNTTNARTVGNATNASRTGLP